MAEGPDLHTYCNVIPVNYQQAACLNSPFSFFKHLVHVAARHNRHIRECEQKPSRNESYCSSQLIKVAAEEK